MAAQTVSRPIKASLAILALVFLGVAGARSLSSAEPVDQETARLVTLMVNRFHINRPEIDDAASAAFLDTYLKDLDPLHLYFLQSDIDEFNKHRTTLDDELARGDVEFGYMVHARYVEKVLAQCDLADKLIDMEHDFTIEETKEADYSKLDWAKSQAELNERWRKFVKYDLLLSKIADQDMKKEKEDLHKRYRNMRRIVQQRGKFDILEIYLSSMTRCFDPHSSYMSPQSYEDFQIDLSLSLDGIGAALRADDGYTVVASIVPNGAADKDKRLKVGDRIIGVGQVDPKTGEHGEIEDIYEQKLSEIVRKIRGPRGTKLLLKVQLEGGTETKVYEITRQKIELTEAAAHGEIIDCAARVGRPGKVGVIYLPQFYRDFAAAQRGDKNFKSAARDMKEFLDQFREAGVDLVIVDLRNNTGGSLTEAIDISGQFIDRGPVLQVRDSTSSSSQVLEDEDSGTLWNGPLVVVCNRMSASASEIFAGAMKDYNRAIIVGDTTTHGKGTVQNLMDVAPNQLFRTSRDNIRGELKVTIQQFYRVNGDSTQNRGVISDIMLPSLLDQSESGESFLEHALPFDSIPPAKYVKNRFVTPEIIADVKQRSQQRVAASKDFTTMQNVIARYLEKKNRKVVSLNETKLKAERELDKAVQKMGGELDPEKEAEKELEAEQNGTKPVFPDNYYNSELLNISLDYLQDLKAFAAAKAR
ncbi:MAG: carboxy terminal-processing peptidase [Planctomycetaceae bacterium]